MHPCVSQQIGDFAGDVILLLHESCCSEDQDAFWLHAQLLMFPSPELGTSACLLKDRIIVRGVCLAVIACE